MNGRIYEPRLGRMLSPDPVTQAPKNGQNYNRYSYAYNNPLKYTDPSGYQSNKKLVLEDGNSIFAQEGQSPTQVNYSFSGGLGVIEQRIAPPPLPSQYFSGSSHSATNQSTVGGIVSTSGTPQAQNSPVGINDAAMFLHWLASNPVMAKLFVEFAINIDIAYELGADGDAIGYIDLIRSGGEWDYKSRREYRNLAGIEDFGNFSFGVTGAAWADGFTEGWSNQVSGLTTNLLMRGAGAYQEFFQSYDPSNGHFYDISLPQYSNYGDQHGDQSAIQKGAHFYFDFWAGE